MAEDEMDEVFHTLAHRRRVLDLLGKGLGVSVGQLALNIDVSRITIMKHLAALERAGLNAFRTIWDKRVVPPILTDLPEKECAWG